MPDQITCAVRELEDRQRGGHHSSQQSAAVLAAIAAFYRENISKRFRLELRTLCAIWQDDRTYPLIHFYDFEHPNPSHNTQFARDYFIVPRGILIGIASLYASAADWRLRLEANRILNVFISNITQNLGVYKAQSDQYAATKDQAWVILLLSLSLDYPRNISLFHRALALAVDPKPATWFWNVFLPVTLVVAFEGFALAIGPAGEWGIGAGLPKMLAEALSLLAATLGGVVLHHSAGRIARKLLPGY